MRFRLSVLFLACVSFVSVTWIAQCRLGSKTFVTQLRKLHAKNVSTGDQSHGHGFFVGEIDIGKPTSQKLSGIFTTSTGLVVIPGSGCQSPSCLGHRRYAPTMSEASIDINKDGSPVDPKGGRRAPVGVPRHTVSVDFAGSHGKGTGLEGNLVQDEVCMGSRKGADHLEPLCMSVNIVVTTKQDDEVFGTQPEDGMIGLARKQLAVDSDFNLLERVSAAGLKSQFGFFVEDDASQAEVTFGGHDFNRVQSGFSWVPVAAPDEGLWTVSILRVKVGKKTIAVCEAGSEPCVGLISTGSAKIHIPEEVSKLVTDEIGTSSSKVKGCVLPDLSFELSSGVVLRLAVEDYAGPKCEPEVGPQHMHHKIANMSLWILGEPLLRRYYTVFDWSKLRVGFARSKIERNCQRLLDAGFPIEQFECVWPRERSTEL